MARCQSSSGCGGCSRPSRFCASSASRPKADMEATQTQQTAEGGSAPTFADMPLSDEVKRALDEIGYTHPTPVQLVTYDLVVEGRDIIVQARTGTGKTAAFAIPLVDRIIKRDQGMQALVLAPTRELALQSSKE